MGGGKASNPSRKGKGKANVVSAPAKSSNADVEKVSNDMADVSLDSVEEDGWEVCTRKSRNKAAPAVNSWGSSNSARRTWGHPETVNRGTDTGGGASGALTPAYSKDLSDKVTKTKSSDKNWESAYMVSNAPSHVVAPPLVHGWQWAATHNSQMKTAQDGSDYTAQQGVDRVNNSNTNSAIEHPADSSSGDDEYLDDFDDECSDGYDSDASQKSFGTRKKSNWFKKFFEILDTLTIDQVNEPTRQWHCPACRDGPGAIDWYKGLQPLIAHAKTKGSIRAKLHREFAELLEDELQRRGAQVVLAGEAFGKWKGLRETASDREIIWPPMVVIMNTQLELDEDEKWIGMGNQELLEYFQGYEAVKARHSYGPRGHRGTSLLIFDATAVGYLEAERLDKHFVEQGTDRETWDRRKVLFYPGGKRQLYGFLAIKEDVDNFNKHCQGKSRLRFEMRSYHEMVVNQLKQMSEDNLKLIYLKNKVAKQEKHAKTLEESFGIVTQKWRESMNANRITNERIMTLQSEHKEEMEAHENYINEQITKIQKTTQRKEELFERSLQEERAKAKQVAVASGIKDHNLREKEIARFIKAQVKEVEDFEAARKLLIQSHEEKRVELRRRYLEEEVKLEKEFDAKLTELMQKYASVDFQTITSS